MSLLWSTPIVLSGLSLTLTPIGLWLSAYGYASVLSVHVLSTPRRAFWLGAVFMFISSTVPKKRSLGATDGLAQMVVSIQHAVGSALAVSLEPSLCRSMSWADTSQLNNLRIKAKLLPRAAYFLLTRSLKYTRVKKQNWGQRTGMSSAKEGGKEPYHITSRASHRQQRKPVRGVGLIRP
ncbi:hypothetical protein EDB86DRAFT_2832672 [Lactarius hatsudake]|nr:hypothetical protein EDB86DRAFT_2832672 [Lactarius hatsudake]